MTEPLCASSRVALKRFSVLTDGSNWSGIMDMMKDMYDEGDDNMKKIIGERE